MRRRVEGSGAGVQVPAGRRVMLAGLWLGLCSGCMATGRVESSGAEVLDLVAKQTAAVLSEYERDLQAVDTDRQHAVVQCLADRVKRDGVEKVDMHAAALQQALDRIAADRQIARQRYETAMDNVEVMHEVAGGLRRYGERLSRFNASFAGSQ